jgi:hypothetical protein
MTIEEHADLMIKKFGTKETASHAVELVIETCPISFAHDQDMGLDVIVSKVPYWKDLLIEIQKR